MRRPQQNWPLKNHHGRMRFPMVGGGDASGRITQTRILAAGMGGFPKRFWSMSLLLVVLVVGVWWLRGWMSKREIGGLKGEISVKNGEISLLERQLKDAIDQTEASIRATEASERALEELKKEFQNYKAAVSAKGSNASSTKL